MSKGRVEEFAAAVAGVGCHLRVGDEVVAAGEAAIVHYCDFF